jgi:V/A-type H+/Na+-transporting ATPase subunit E
MPATLTESEKIQQICDALRRETLEPARVEAERLVQETEEECRRRVREAQQEAERIHQEARQQIQKEREVAQSQLQQAVRQALSILRQSIEEQVLNQGLAQQLSAPLKNPQVIAQLLTALVKGLEKDGLATDLEAVVAQGVDAGEVTRLLGQELLQKLRGGAVEVGRFEGGVRLKLHEDQLVIDVTAETLRELLATYLRKDFRQMLFKE